MKLERLVLKNFKRHTDRTIDFHPGVTAIVGPNGSGKSTVFDAVVGAITNDFVSKTYDVNQLAAANERASVQLEFSHKGTSYRIVRELRPAGSKDQLFINNDKPILGDRNITSRLAEVIGVSSNTFSEQFLVGQGRLAEVFKQQPATRAKFFQQMFGFEKAGKIWKLLGDEASKASYSDFSAAIESLQVEKTAVVAQIAALTAAVAAVPAIPLEAVTAAKKTIAAFQEADRARKDFE